MGRINASPIVAAMQNPHPIWNSANKHLPRQPMSAKTAPINSDVAVAATTYSAHPFVTLLSDENLAEKPLLQGHERPPLLPFMSGPNSSNVFLPFGISLAGGV